MGIEQSKKQYHYDTRVGGVRTLRSIQIAAILALTGLFTLPAAADIALGVSPMEVQLKAPQQGGRVTDDFEVYNSGDTALHVVGYVVDWTLTKAGEIQFQEPASHPQSCAAWVQMNPVQFNLPPKKAIRVRYTIGVPEGLNSEHWTMVFFQSRPQQVKGTGLSVSARVGCKVFVAPAQRMTKQGAITNMELEQASVPVLKVTFENSGKTHVRVSGTFEVRGEDDRVLTKGELQPPAAQVLAGASRELRVKLEELLPPGTWRIRTVVDYGGRELVSGELKVTSQRKESGEEGKSAGAE